MTFLPVKNSNQAGDVFPIERMKVGVSNRMEGYLHEEKTDIHY